MGSVTLEQLIEEEAKQQKTVLQRREKRHSMPPWMPFVLDVIVTGILLCVFALFHHVIPFALSSDTPADPPVIDTQPDPEPETPGITAPFTAEIVKTETGYTSPNIAVTVEKHTMGEEDELVTYYVADVRLRSIDCFRTAFAKDTFGQGIKEGLLDIANRHNAIVALSGDYYGMHASKSVVRNGVVYRQKNGDEDVCVLYRDGTMKIFYNNETFNAKQEVENGAWQAWSFGPSLFKKDGTPLTSYSGYLAKEHPRSAIGYYEAGHYAFVVVDGRAANYSQGVTMAGLASLMKELGCTLAYNLDGGQTAQMAFGGEVVNQPYKGGRVVSDILYIGEVE